MALALRLLIRAADKSAIASKHLTFHGKHVHEYEDTTLTELRDVMQLNKSLKQESKTQQSTILRLEKKILKLSSFKDQLTRIKQQTQERQNLIKALKANCKDDKIKSAKAEIWKHLIWLGELNDDKTEIVMNGPDAAKAKQLVEKIQSGLSVSFIRAEKGIFVGLPHYKGPDDEVFFFETATELATGVFSADSTVYEQSDFLQELHPSRYLWKFMKEFVTVLDDPATEVNYRVEGNRGATSQKQADGLYMNNLIDLVQGCERYWMHEMQSNTKQESPVLNTMKLDLDLGTSWKKYPVSGVTSGFVVTDKDDHTLAFNLKYTMHECIDNPENVTEFMDFVDVISNWQFTPSEADDSFYTLERRDLNQQLPVVWFVVLPTSNGETNKISWCGTKNFKIHINDATYDPGTEIELHSKTTPIQVKSFEDVVCTIKWEITDGV